MVMGRPNKGLAHVDSLDAGAFEKDRLRVILATVTGEMSVTDGCETLGIGRAHFARIRTEALQGAIEALSPGRPGRPRRAEPPAEVAAMKREITELRQQLDKRVLERDLVVAMAGLEPSPEKGGGRQNQARRLSSKPKPRRASNRLKRR